MAIAFGIDIGGSGVKGAPVDLETGELTQERFRIETPYPATPQAVSKTAAEVLAHFDLPEDVPVGICFPGPLPGGYVRFMANLDQEWVGKNAVEVFSEAIGREVAVLNDADAAGLAEQQYGVFKDQPGVTVFTTLGTGIGTALFVDGVMVPNTELGHIQVDGHDAETRASAAVRKREDLSWKKWAKRLTKYYREMEKLFSPDLFVVGGGVSRKHEKFLPLVDISTPIIAAELRNTAGIVGAAAAGAARQQKRA
ncbi:ROK family protein [Varibaculum cambriense]|nr:ROK family protein [Varibaculum cambriense]